MLNFDFLEKGLGIVFPKHFVYDFQEKCFSCYIRLTDQNLNLWLPLLLEILGNMCIAIASFPCCDVINFEISLIFQTKPFFYMIKNSGQKSK